MFPTSRDPMYIQFRVNLRSIYCHSVPNKPIWQRYGLIHIIVSMPVSCYTDIWFNLSIYFTGFQSDALVKSHGSCANIEMQIASATTTSMLQLFLFTFHVNQWSTYIQDNCLLHGLMREDLNDFILMKVCETVPYN